MPIARAGDPATSSAAAVQVQPIRSVSPDASSAGRPCETLSLVLGAIQLDLLGNSVQLNEASVDFIALPGIGDRFGNLLCDVSGRMDGSASSTELVRMLNTLLEAIG